MLYTISTGKDPEEDFPELPGSLETGEFEKGFLGFNKIVLRACEHDVEKRYQSAREMHADLEQLVNRKPVGPALQKGFRKMAQVALGLAVLTPQKLKIQFKLKLVAYRDD